MFQPFLALNSLILKGEFPLLAVQKASVAGDLETGVFLGPHSVEHVEDALEV